MRIGIAGWSYPDWAGFVYPRGVRDPLRYAAGYVDLIEINNSFYRPPDAGMAAAWVKRTADLPDFFFTAKLHQDITHGGRIDPDMVKAFHDGFKPLAEAGKLKHLLAQFKWDFADGPEARQHIREIASRFGDIAHVTFELRHISWQAANALDHVRALGATVANLDYPQARNSFSMPVCTVGEHAYFRLHGRNAKAWFSQGAGRDETYNYLYSGKELDEIVRRAMQVGAMSKSLTLVANNHYQGKEMVNALQIKARLTGRKVAVPPPLLEKYPDLAAIASAEGGALL